MCLRTLAANRDKDAALHRKLRHSAQRDAPVLFDVSRHGVQDFVSHTAFHSVRNNRNRLRCGVEPGERIWRRLPDELEDRGSDTQNSTWQTPLFPSRPALSLPSQPGSRIMLIVFHNFKTPRTSRFVCWLLIVHDWF